MNKFLWKWTSEAVTIRVEDSQEIQLGNPKWESGVEVVMADIQGSELG